MPTMTLYTFSCINNFKVFKYTVCELKINKRTKIYQHFFQALAFTLKEVESASSPFTTYYGIRSKHDSVIPTSPTAQDWGTLTVMVFSKELTTTKIPPEDRIWRSDVMRRKGDKNEDQLLRYWGTWTGFCY